MLKREELSIIIGSVSIPRRRPQIVLSQLHAYYKLKGRVHIFKKIVVFFSSPRLVDQISPIVDGPRSNIFDHDGRTPEHHSSCQGSRNSKVSPIGEERKKLCHELVNSPFNTFHFFLPANQYQSIYAWLNCFVESGKVPAKYCNN